MKRQRELCYSVRVIVMLIVLCGCVWLTIGNWLKTGRDYERCKSMQSIIYFYLPGRRKEKGEKDLTLFFGVTWEKKRLCML